MQARICQSITVLACAALLAACETTSGMKDEPGAQPEPTQDQGTTSGTTQGAGAGAAFQGDPLDDPASLLSTRVVYFEYDSSEILGADRPVIEAHGRYLADHAGASVTLEGHADERGSREYNIALGERRGNAVLQLMNLLGASGSQIRVVSYGEERPAVDGHDESSWSQNRRVEIVYRSR